MMNHSLTKLVTALLLIWVVRIAQADDKPSFLGKSYKLESSKNFDKFMEALGVDWLTRKTGALLSPTVTLTKSEKTGKYTLKTVSTFKTTIIHFKHGEEFDEEAADGRHVKSTITIDGNKMTHFSKGLNGQKNFKIVREYFPTEMIARMTVDDIVSTRIYKLEK